MNERVEGRLSIRGNRAWRWVRSLLVVGIASLVILGAGAQEPTQPQTLDHTRATLHGVVRNAATGEGLPRAQVRIEGDADTGTLTDGEGRFEFPGIAVGPQVLLVRKPGFRDGSHGGGAATERDTAGSTHNVMVAAEMPDVVFTLSPTCAIHGQIQLSTGDGAQGITIALVQRAIENGRAVWQARGFAKTHSDGSFRFGGLADGEYGIYSEPVLDDELNGTPGAGDTGEHWGYASVFYPDARESSGAGRIRLSNGQDVQANMTLTREAFQVVKAVTTAPQVSGGERGGTNYSAVVLDGTGNQTAYKAQYDAESHSVQALLPDGSYTLLVSSIPRIERRGGQGNLNAWVLVGMADFSVAGRAVPNVRVALGAPRPNPVQFSVVRNSGQGLPASRQASQVLVMVSRAGGWLDDGMVGMYADGAAPGPLEAVYTMPGAYWVHTHVQQKGLCEASFTAGGTNLAREPVIFGLSGATANMDLTLRDDCAQLQVSLPETVAGITAGEEKFFTVYVVPDFDSTMDVEALTLRASTGGSYTVDDLTPGDYHIYTFEGAVRLEYKNREALAHQGQAVALSAGTTSSVVLEVPGP